MSPRIDSAAGAVFLDRDGVINEVVVREGRPASPRSLAEFRWAGRVQDAVVRLKQAGWLVLVVSNQPDIARGFLSRRQLDGMSARIRQYLPIDDISICPHDDRDQCACRKPKPGLLLALADRWRVDLGRSFLVGDTWRDMVAGQRAGCRTILLERPYNVGTESGYQVADLMSATDLVLRLASGESIG